MEFIGNYQLKYNSNAGKRSYFIVRKINGFNIRSGVFKFLKPALNGNVNNSLAPPSI